MRTRCQGGYAATAAILVAARATPVIMVDDSDPGIEYRGVWTRNPWGRQNVNYWSSVTFTNASGSTATYRFQGTAIAVFGAFEMTGTFNVHSSYSVDGGPATDFVPADTFVSFEYGQKFFQSDSLSDEEHTLVITNLGEEFWFDYLEVTQPPPTTTTTAASSQSTATQRAQTTPASTAQATSSTTDRAITGSGGQPETAQSLSSPSFQTQSTHSFANTNNVTLTSTDAAATPPPYASGASQSQTSILASGAATPGSTAARTDSFKLPAGAIAGLAIAGFVVLILVGLAGRSRRGRRKQAQRRNDLTPYDPGLTALAFEPSENVKEKRDREHDGNSRESTAASLLSLPQPTPAHALPQGEIRAGGTSGERNLAHGIRTTDLEETAGRGGGRRTGFEPLGSLSSAFPLLPRHPGGMRTKDTQIAPSAGTSRYLSPVDERRRSMDGGVRLAGGPMESERQEGDRGDDARSGVSTLPPAYGLYPAA